MSKACSLHYVSASHGGWGIVRMAALVPEAHLLFVCPSACGRHNAVGASVAGIKHRVSYLFLTEADIVSGDFEQMIVDNVDILFEALPKKPRALLIFTSCLDDLLGTDHEPILAELTRRNPDVKFRHCTMNPISLDSKLPPGVTTYRNMFSVLEKREETKNLVNVLGSNVTYDKTSELKRLLKTKGYRVANIADYTDFDSFMEMASARLNLVVSPIALKTAEMMEKEFGIPYLTAYITYDPEEITEVYRKLEKALDLDFSPALEEEKEKAYEEIQKAKEVIGDYPIAVDYQAVLRPYNLALMMSRNGFHMGMVASDSVSTFEKPSFEALKKEDPEVLIENPMSHNAVKFPHEGEKYLCIGFDCGYMTGSDRVADLMEDEGMFGFYGTRRLMEMLREAYRSKADVREMIVKAGLII